MTAFLERLEPGAALVVPGVMDPLSALIVESLQFPAVYLGGHAMGSHLGIGQPRLDLTDTVAITANVARTVRLPVVVDGGAGFGGAIHIERLVRDLHAAGAAAVHIDDQPYPKRAAYHRGAGTVTDVREAAERYSAGRDAAAGTDVSLIARTDVYRATGSLTQTVERSHAYVEAGAEAVLILDLDPVGLRQIRDDLPSVPIGWIGGVENGGPTIDQLNDGGFAFALHPFTGLAATVNAVHGVWSAFREHGVVTLSPDELHAAKQRIIEITGLERLWTTEEGEGR